jgi:signal transduction histidine kinase
MKFSTPQSSLGATLPQAQRLRQVAGITATVLALRCAAEPWLAADPLLTGVLLTALAFMLTVLTLNACGQTRRGSLLFVATFALMAAFMAWMGEGNRDAILTIYPGILVLTGLLVSVRAAVGMLVFVLASITVMAWADLTGAQVFLEAPPGAEGYWARFADLVAIFVCTGLTLMIFIKDLHDAFSRAQRTEARLVEHQNDLERLVAERTRELAQAKDAAERASQAKSDFLSNMSHELRTPMNAILGFAQMLENDATLNADQRDSAEEILKGGRHLLELINEVLDLAKIESGHIEVALESVPLASVVEDCRRLIQPLADQRGIVLTFDASDAAVVRADRVRLKQILLNYLSNAVKYNREAGRVRLETAAGSVAGRWRIAVIDTGPGIPPERMGELFQSFNRLGAESSGIEGIGIGLALTRRLAVLMDGEVGAESRVGEGSTFWFELPAAERES